MHQSHYPGTGRQSRLPEPKRSRSWVSWILRGLVLASVLWETGLLVQVIWWRTHNPVETAFMKLRSESRQQRGLPALAPHPWVSYEHIPNSLKRAVIAAEDSRFVHHSGFDWQGIQYAYQRDMRLHRAISGGSTITQQLAKNLFLSENRTVWRKAQESLLTLMLEVLWSKRRILEVYLNTIEWGDGQFGCAAASQHYFHESVQHLNPAQAARLASMIPRPRFYDHHGPTDRLLNKTNVIEQRLHQVDIP